MSERIEPHQDKYPGRDESRPSAAQLWKLWKGEQERADKCEKVGFEWMKACLQAQEQRDQARVQVCLLSCKIKHGDEFELGQAREIARQLGWDCFKEKSNP